MPKRPKKTLACPKCGLEQERWKTPDGYPYHGEAYCCEDCAHDTGCLCIPEPEETRFRRFARGGSLGAQPGI